MSEVYQKIKITTYCDAEDFLYLSKAWDNNFQFYEDLRFDVDSIDDVKYYQNGAKYGTEFKGENLLEYDAEVFIFNVLVNVAKNRPDIFFDATYFIEYYNCNETNTTTFSYFNNTFTVDRDGWSYVLKLKNGKWARSKDFPFEVKNSYLDTEQFNNKSKKNSFSVGTSNKTDQINILIEKKTVKWCMKKLTEVTEYSKPCILIDFIDSPFQVVAINTNSGNIVFEIYKQMFRKLEHVPNGVLVWNPKTNSSEIKKEYDGEYFEFDIVKNNQEYIIDAYKAINMILSSSKDLNSYESKDLENEDLLLSIQDNQIVSNILFENERPNRACYGLFADIEYYPPLPFDRKKENPEFTTKLLDEYNQ
ncbi:MAG: hypothetical protein KBT48_05895 [Firmicutes bacterium]|nr:hypothetical protein [Bacillota bacterium]